jgi:hypothetical protein
MQKSTDGWQLHEREQMRARLALSYAERLRCLEQAKQFARSALGAANSDYSRVSTFVQTLWPDSRVTLRRFERAWMMDIAVGARRIVVEYRPAEGFGVSEDAGDASDHFTGHSHVLSTAAELEVHLRALARKT